MSKFSETALSFKNKHQKLPLPNNQNNPNTQTPLSGEFKLVTCKVWRTFPEHFFFYHSNSYMINYRNEIRLKNWSLHQILKGKRNSMLNLPCLVCFSGQLQYEEHVKARSWFMRSHLILSLHGILERFCWSITCSVYLKVFSKLFFMPRHNIYLECFQWGMKMLI